jgi:hypothetical protein
MTEVAQTTTNEKSDAERKAALDSALQLKGAQGWRIENRSDYQATVAKGKQHSHGLHIFLSIITAGLWAIFVWIPLVVIGGLKRRMISIDSYGNTHEQKL